MSGSSTIRLEIPDKNIKVEFTGDENTVVRDLLKFLSNVYPRLTIIDKIVYTPDLEALLSAISSHIRISSGEIILLGEDAKTTESKILYLLAGCYVASRFGLREKGSMSVEEMVRMVTNISKKTIQNTLVDLVKKGLVLRQARGMFEISVKGIMLLSGGVEAEKASDKPNPAV
ncbi:MAG: hypothetical protein N3F08_03560 [Crenarchaeota archaeon]|nr:hypothetical protein [Thermoproteota archaeon]